MSFLGRDLQRQWSAAFVLSVIGSVFLTAPLIASAAYLNKVSDTISDSTPSATSTNHTIQFTVTNTIPPGGKIVITPEATAGIPFTIPVALDFTDVDVATAILPAPYTDRSLAAAQTAIDDGVSVVSGVTGSITLTLASGLGFDIPAGTTVVIKIGNNAIVGATGDQFIASPSSARSYHIRIQTKDASNADIDTGVTLVAMVLPVGVSIEIPAVDVVRSNGLPSGLLPGATTNVLLSLNTDIPATCRYATTTGVLYSLMSGGTDFTAVNFNTLHYREEVVTQNTIYNFYVRCQTLSLIANTTDYLINFEVGVIPSASSTPLPPPPPPTPPSPSGGGSGGNFLKGGDVTLDGITIPQGSLVILQDGVIVKEEAVSVLGTFTDLFSNLQRGTYTYGVYVKDANGNKSSTYNSTIYLIGGTNNIIAPIYLSPTIVAASTTVPIGGDIQVSGFGIPLKKVLGVLNKQGNAQTGILTASTTANGNGSWKLTFSTAGLTKGTYQVKAQTLISSKDQSIFSPVLYIGVGENPNPDFKNRSDLNRDGKVNLVDFSILLFNWKTSDAVADINQDGTVNLTDFSIMLANWTG